MTYADRCWTLVELVEFCVLRCDMMYSYLLLIKAGNEHSFMYRWLWSYKQYGHVCATKGSLDCDYTNSELLGGFPKGGGPQNGWFRNIMDKLTWIIEGYHGVPPFMDTFACSFSHIFSSHFPAVPPFGSEKFIPAPTEVVWSHAAAV